jgi:hypothetical protein
MNEGSIVVLYSGTIKIFVLFSIVIHVSFALLFAQVTLSFSPPTVRELSLTLVTRGGVQGEIIPSEAAWPMPPRAEPPLSVNEVLTSLDAEIEEWAQFGLPDSSFFSPDKTLIPHLEIADLAGRAHIGTSEGLFSQLPAESKATPIADFALGPAVPEMFEDK